MLHRPLWLDVGGIAKGFAVDRAAARLQQWSVPAFLINAGGDMRIHGEGLERVALAAHPKSGDEVLAPVLEVSNASVASSRSPSLEEWQEDRAFGPHVDGAQRTRIPPGRFACVVAEDCIVADALTKVVMAMGEKSDEILGQYGAIAYLHDPATGWQYLNEKLEEA
jgi:thiamine biosynthesis lipoprotein